MKIYHLGGLTFGGKVIMETANELVIEVGQSQPWLCPLFIRIPKKEENKP